MLDWLIPAAHAHEKWFVQEAEVAATSVNYLSWNSMTVIGALVIGGTVLLAYLLDIAWERSARYAALEKRIRPYRDYAAGALAVLTGFTLLVMSAQGAVFAPELLSPEGGMGAILIAAQSLIGVLLILGLYSPLAGIGLFLTYLLAFASFDFLALIDYLHYPAIGLFIAVFARGRYSLDWFLGKPILSTPEQRKIAYFLLRVLVGLAVIWLASIKLLRPELHLALLDAYPDFNPYVIAQAIGLDMSREAYVFILFCVEATVGLFLTFGLLTRVMAVLLVPIFSGSVIFLGLGDLVGHLPLIGLLFVFFIYGDTYHKNRDPDRYSLKRK